MEKQVKNLSPPDEAARHAAMKYAPQINVMMNEITVKLVDTIAQFQDLCGQYKDLLVLLDEQMHLVVPSTFS
jgi:hypothetical protein